MSVVTIRKPPVFLALAGFHRLSVAAYTKLVELGELSSQDRVELLNGYMVQKMPQNPPHSNASTNLEDVLSAVLPAGWLRRTEKPLTLKDSVPEPDVAIARGGRGAFAHRHPLASDIGLVVEVSDSSLPIDRVDKGLIYAENGLPIYWIVNVVERQIEVYTDPRPSDPAPAYATRTDYKPGATVPFILDGQLVANIPVIDIVS